jgi:predicted lipoprotein with Yx(FWY)xxD motif
MQSFIAHIATRRGLPLLAFPAAGVAMLAAACGSAGTTGSVYGGSGSSTGSAGAGASSGGNPYRPAAQPAAGALSVKVGMSGLGSFLTDGQGRTLYLFTRDSGGASSCSGGCTSVWPPVTSSTAVQVGTGASASLLGTTSRGGGQMQVTYNGHPLYYYVGDINPGDTNGEQLNQFGGLWYAVSPGGMQVSH